MIYLILILLMILNGTFAMFEIAVVSCKKYKIKILAEKGNTSAQKLMKFMENTTHLFSTMQIGITIVSIFLGMYSNETLSNKLAIYLNQYIQSLTLVHLISQVVVLVNMTFFFVLIGEIIPKKIGINYPDTIALNLVYSMHYFAALTSPINKVLMGCNDAILKLFSLTAKRKEISEEDLKNIITNSVEVGIIKDIEKKMVHKVFEFGQARVNDIFRFKNKIIYINYEDQVDEIKKKIKSFKHSIYPVISNNNKNDIIGIVSVKDLIFINFKEEFINSINRKPLVVYENLYAYNLLEKFKQYNQKFSLVVNEYGSFIGIVTIDDVIKSLLVIDNNIFTSNIIEINKNTWLIEGQMGFTNFCNFFNIGIDDIKMNNTDIVTLAGYFLHIFNETPQKKDKIKIKNFTLEIIEMDEQRIDKILIYKT